MPFFVTWAVDQSIGVNSAEASDFARQELVHDEQCEAAWRGPQFASLAHSVRSEFGNAVERNAREKVMILPAALADTGIA